MPRFAVAIVVSGHPGVTAGADALLANLAFAPDVIGHFAEQWGVPVRTGPLLFHFPVALARSVVEEFGSRVPAKHA